MTNDRQLAEELITEAEKWDGFRAGIAGIDEVIPGFNVARIDDQGVAFPVAHRFAVIGVDYGIGIGPVATVKKDLSEAVVEIRHDIDNRRQLYHHQRPHAGLQHRDAGRKTLADRIAIGTVCGSDTLTFFEIQLSLADEFRVRRTEHEVGEPLAGQIDKPRAGQIPRRVGSLGIQIGRRERSELLTAVPRN